MVARVPLSNITASANNKPANSSSESREIRILEKCKDIAEVLQAGERPKEDLFSLLERNLSTHKSGTISVLANSNRLNIAVDLVRALEKVHAQGIIHRNVNSENVFLLETAKGCFRAKLGGFDSACERTDRVARLELTDSAGWFSRKSAKLLANGSFGKDQSATFAVRTTQDDMDPLAYLLFLLLHPYHFCLPHQLINDREKSILAIAQLSRTELLGHLKAIPERYRGIFEGIFFKNWTAKDVRIALETILPPPLTIPEPEPKPYVVPTPQDLVKASETDKLKGARKPAGPTPPQYFTWEIWEIEQSLAPPPKAAAVPVRAPAAQPPLANAAPAPGPAAPAAPAPAAVLGGNSNLYGDNPMALAVPRAKA